MTDARFGVVEKSNFEFTLNLDTGYVVHVDPHDVCMVFSMDRHQHRPELSRRQSIRAIALGE